MSSSEEDSYSMIFASLKHPIRRKILRILSSEPQTFSNLQKQFNIESSHLTYHIDGLGNLLCKTQDGKYALSSLGDAAVSIMRKVEEPSSELHLPLMRKPLRMEKQILVLASLCIILAVGLVGVLAYYVPQVNDPNRLNRFLTPTTTIGNIVHDPSIWENQTVAITGKLFGPLFYFTSISWDYELSANGTVYPQDSLGPNAIGVNLSSTVSYPFNGEDVVLLGVVRRGYIGTIIIGESPTVSYYIEAKFVILE